MATFLSQQVPLYAVLRDFRHQPLPTSCHTVDKLRDDIVSVMAIWALHGIVFLFSIPVVIVIGCFRIMRALLHPK